MQAEIVNQLEKKCSVEKLKFQFATLPVFRKKELILLTGYNIKDVDAPKNGKKATWIQWN